MSRCVSKVRFPERCSAANTLLKLLISMCVLLFVFNTSGFKCVYWNDGTKYVNLMLKQCLTIHVFELLYGLASCTWHR